MGSAISSVFKGAGSVFGLGNQNPQYTIGTDPESMKAAYAAQNESADLSGDNTPTIQSGGQTNASSDTLTSRRRKSTTGVASNLGVGS